MLYADGVKERLSMSMQFQFHHRKVEGVVLQ